MLNKFPLWKNIMLVVIIILGIIYALPNLYGDDPAVQITGSTSKAMITPALEQEVTQTLKQQNLQYKAVERDDDSLLIRFYDTDSQFKARSLIKSLVGNQYTVAVNLVPATPSWLRAIGAKPMKLGLDLRGGIHFLLDVDVNGVIAKRLDGMAKTMTEQLRSKRIRYSGVKRTADNTIVLDFRNQQEMNQALAQLKGYFPNMDYKESTNNGYQLIAIPTPTWMQNVRQYTIDQTATTLRNRINELGIAEPIVQQQGAERIAVDLPGVQDSARAKQILGGTATLEFHLVNTSADANTVQATGVAPPGTKLYHMSDGRPILLDNQVVLSGNSITSATSTYDQNGQPVVNITLGGSGQAYFTKVTRENIGNQMAIVYVETKTVNKMVDGKPVRTHKREQKVISAPVIQSALPSQFQITGINDVQEARKLALLLRAGAMPAAIDIVQERTVGPSLGKENIRMGMISVEVAFVLIVVFMAVYYMLMGIYADLALLLNLILIVAIMSMLGMTLTLPGIAGIVLTVGMAVDANVLIFERIREELRNGATPQAAIHAGFERAFSTIVDANVTTLIVAVVLFAIGTGAVQGFAVTLTVGLLTSMFTAITFTRGLVNWTYGGRQVDKISLGIKPITQATPQKS